MDNEILNTAACKKNPLKSDNSDYFSKWGSRKPFITLREEIDNQLCAHPSNAGISIFDDPDGACRIITYNDGDIPSHERVERMYMIGKTTSDKKGVSLCGVGQIEGLIAGRSSARGNGKLTFECVRDGLISRFVCSANGYENKIDTEFTVPIKTNKVNGVKKQYEEMLSFTEVQKKEAKALYGVKASLYMKRNPNSVFTFNGERVNPIDVLYSGVNDSRIKRLDFKNYNFTYHGKDYDLGVGAVDLARFLKPDGVTFKEELANEWDRIYRLSPNSTGIFVSYDDDIVVTGGKDTWDLLGRGYHSTHNAQNVLICFPNCEELKEELFCESPDKSILSTSLLDIRDYDGRQVFKEIVDDVKHFLDEWSIGRGVVDKRGNLVEKENEKNIMKDILKNDRFIKGFSECLDSLNEKQKIVLCSKKVSTLLKLINKKQKSDDAQQTLF